MSIITCFHVTPWKNLQSIIDKGIVPGGDGKGRVMSFFTPYAPWDARCQGILPTKTFHDEMVVVIYIDALTMCKFGSYVDMDGHIMADRVIPFSQVQGMWYRYQNSKWKRLLVHQARTHFVESVTGACKMARKDTLCERARTVIDYLTEIGEHNQEVEYAKEWVELCEVNMNEIFGEEFHPEKEPFMVHRTALSTKRRYSMLPSLPT